MKHVLGWIPLALLLAAGGCGAEKKTSSVVLGFSTDMSVPDDVKAVALFVSANGKVVFHELSEAKSVDGKTIVQFPSTFAVYAYENNRERLRIQLVAYGKNSSNTPRVVRDSITTVPSGRSVLLRMPLLWINQIPDAATQSSALRTQFTGGNLEANGCPENQSRYAGKCAPIEEIDSDTLPDYSDDLVFGGGGKSCFDVAGCFEKSAVLRINNDCSVEVGATPLDHLNLALDARDGSGVNAGNGKRLLVIDKDSKEGWTVQNGRAVLAAGFCDLLQAGRADLVATAACEAKTELSGTCGPWNEGSANPKKPDAPADISSDAAIDVSIDRTVPRDGGAPDGTAFVDAAPDGGDPTDASGVPMVVNIGAVEKGIQDVTVIGGRVYATRFDPNNSEPSVVSFDNADVDGMMNSAAPMSLNLNFAAGDSARRGGYHVESMDLYGQGPYLMVYAYDDLSDGLRLGKLNMIGPMNQAAPLNTFIAIPGTNANGFFGIALAAGGYPIFYGRYEQFVGQPHTGYWDGPSTQPSTTVVNFTPNSNRDVTATAGTSLLPGAVVRDPATGFIYLGTRTEIGSGNKILRCATNGDCSASASDVVATITDGCVASMAIDSGFIFYLVVPPSTATNSVVYRVPVMGGTPTLLTSSIGDAAGFYGPNSTVSTNELAVDSKWVYFTEGYTTGGTSIPNTHRVLYVDKNATATTAAQVLSAVEWNPRGITATGSYVFWANFGSHLGGVGGRVRRASPP